MAKTAAELIAHLERGGLIATGHPDRALMLRFAMWESPEGRLHKHLGAYGWGSALCDASGLLERVLLEPYKWVAVEARPTSAEMEELARPLLAEIGEPGEDGLWKYTAEESRPPNITTD